jgi:hypothetical protein
MIISSSDLKRLLSALGIISHSGEKFRLTLSIQTADY